MPIRIKVDENLPEQIADLFNAHGYDALTVGDQGWRGLADDELWRRIQAEGRWLVTADKEFGDIRRYRPGSHAGLILLRLSQESRAEYLRLAGRVPTQIKLDEINGAIVVVTERGIRVRRNS
jgi:predicted nuclease of predicted toxin-antitoxin system